MMEAANTSETPVNFYQTTRRNNPEDGHLHTRSRENLKSHIEKQMTLVSFPLEPAPYTPVYFCEANGFTGF
jgi:hypothetical protein